MSSAIPSPEITIIAVAYQRYLHIPILIHSFLVQKTPNWDLVIVHDGYDPQHEAIVRPYTEQFPNIHYQYGKTRYNDYGHTLREQVLQEFPVKEWVLQTNDDNYYVQGFLEQAFLPVLQNPDIELVYWDAIQNINLQTNSHNHSYYGLQQSDLRLRAIDMGSFMIKSELMKQVGFKSRSILADGLFIEALLDQFPQTTAAKVNQCLFVHN